MALKLAHQHASTGIDVPEAYHRVLAVHLNVHADEAVIYVGTYATKAARDAGKAPLEERRLVVQNAEQRAFSPTGQPVLTRVKDFDTWFADAELDHKNMNPRKRAYEYLKSRPDFAGAADA